MVRTRRTFAGQRTFVLIGNTIRFVLRGNLFPVKLEVIKGSNHRNHLLSGFCLKTGGIELMISNKKESAAGKIVAMPEDRTYQNGFRKSKRKDEPVEDSEYISRKGEEALKALRAL